MARARIAIWSCVGTDFARTVEGDALKACEPWPRELVAEDCGDFAVDLEAADLPCAVVEETWGGLRALNDSLDLGVSFWFKIVLLLRK
jgi:hypothetical protein